MRTTRKLWAACAAAVLAIAGAVLPAAASGAAPHDRSVEIIVTETFGEIGTFVAAGGGLCPTGTAEIVGEASLTERPNMLTFELDKEFTCDDGTGSFVVHILARWSPCNPTDHGVWGITSGTGAYADLSGHGQLVGTYFPAACQEEGIVDAMRGVVHRR